MHFKSISSHNINGKTSAVWLLSAAGIFVIAMGFLSARPDETAQNERSKRSTDGIIKQTESNSIWSKLQIFPDAIGSLPFGNYRIDIYEHPENKLVSSIEKKRYYYAPIALLDHLSASSTYNNITQQPEMSFKIQMWSEEIQKSVVEYIQKLILNPVKEEQVNVLPLKMKIMLSGDSHFNNIYLFKRELITYQQHQFIEFTLICFQQSECDELAENMKSSPKHFSNFNLLFIPLIKQSHRKEISVALDNVILNDVFSKLSESLREATEVYITAEYEKRLIAESIENILIDNFEDTEVISKSSETKITKILQSFLVSSRDTIGISPNDQSWDLLYWNEVNYRPDKSAVTLNNIYSRLNDDQKMRFLTSFFEASKSSSGRSNGEFDKIFLHESRDNVMWDGTKFIPKPIRVSKINLSKLRENKQLNQEVKLRVTYLTVVLAVAVNIDPYYDPISSNQLFNIQNKVSKMGNQLAGLLHKHAECSGLSITPENGGIPANCLELNCLGHKINGFYSVRGTNFKTSNKIEKVFCNFSRMPSAPDFETRIGYVDVKSSPVYFYVQRNSSFSTGHTSIPFELERLNIGGAMNLTSGIFTAPFPGIYHFSLSGVKLSPSPSVHVTLQLNEVNVAYSLGNTNNFYETLSLSSTLRLKSGDRITLVLLHGGTLFDDSDHYTHFIGWLIEEDVSLL